MAQFRITEIEDYEALVGAEVVQRIRDKPDKLNGAQGARDCSQKFPADALPRTVSRSVRRAVAGALCAVSNVDPEDADAAERPSYNVDESTPNVSLPVRPAVRRAL